jgi:hypothetical protein
MPSCSRASSRTKSGICELVGSSAGRIDAPRLQRFIRLVPVGDALTMGEL